MYLFYMRVVMLKYPVDIFISSYSQEGFIDIFITYFCALIFSGMLRLERIVFIPLSCRDVRCYVFRFISFHPFVSGRSLIEVVDI